MADTPTNEARDTQLKFLVSSGKFDHALKLADTILKADPDHVQANLAFARVRLMQGIWAGAERYAHRALRAQPDDESTLLLLSNIHGARGHTDEALKWCDRTLEVNPASNPARRNRAQLLERAGDWQAALDTLAPMADHAPPAEFYIITARCQMRKGDPEQAIVATDKGLALFGMDAPTASRMRAHLLLTRARALDKLGRYDEAFADTTAAKSLRAIPFDPDAWVAEYDGIVRTFTAERVKRPTEVPATAHRHVFIAGMPRSGTTLVEQILDAHPQATGVGEAKEIDIYTKRLQSLLGVWSPWPACVADLTPEHRAKLVQSYEQALLAHGFAPAEVFLNKNLQNVRLLGLIAMLFPEAKIIFTHRDPRDVGISCFMGNFKPETHPYLFDLEHIALACRQHDRLIDHWKSVLENQWMDVRYEDIVGNQERVTRELVEFCELPWDDRCLRFHESGRTVMTLSYDQVSKPIYRSSIGRYRNYQNHLGPLLDLVSGE